MSVPGSGGGRSVNDPYKTLGVRRNASSGSIRKAYRALAMKHHPDHNPGDESAVERYREITQAYELLSDSGRRKRFNETGETDAPKPINLDAEFISTVHPFLCGVIMKMVEQGVSTDMHDVLDSIRQNMKRQDSEFKKSHDQLTRTKKALSLAADRFTIEGEENLLAILARNQLSVIDKDLASISGNRERIARALDKLKAYGYRYIQRVASQGGWYATTSATSTW